LNDNIVDNEITDNDIDTLSSTYQDAINIWTPLVNSSTFDRFRSNPATVKTAGGQLWQEHAFSKVVFNSPVVLQVKNTVVANTDNFSGPTFGTTPPTFTYEFDANGDLLSITIDNPGDANVSDSIWFDSGTQRVYTAIAGIQGISKDDFSLLDLEGITDGSAGQVLTTDGAGSFTFTTVSGGGGQTYDQSLNTTDGVTFNTISSTGDATFNRLFVTGSSFLTGILNLSSELRIGKNQFVDQTIYDNAINVIDNGGTPILVPTQGWYNPGQFYPVTLVSVSSTTIVLQSSTPQIISDTLSYFSGGGVLGIELNSDEYTLDNTNSSLVQTNSNELTFTYQASAKRDSRNLYPNTALAFLDNGWEEKIEWSVEELKDVVSSSWQSAPTSSIGVAGDVEGNVAFDSNYMYYCTANYDGSTDVWKRVAWSADTW
jgi:hypothetical protein